MRQKMSHVMLDVMRDEMRDESSKVSENGIA
jgi:hypothetical protein